MKEGVEILAEINLQSLSNNLPQLFFTKKLTSIAMKVFVKDIQLIIFI